MKDFIKTILLVCIIGLIGVLVFYVVGNYSYHVKLFMRTDLDMSDPTVQLLFNRVQSNVHLRKPNLVSSELTSDEIIKFVLDQISTEDYKDKKIKAEKITCFAAYGVYFNTNSGYCNVRVIKNNVFMDYQKKYFNTEIELDYKDINYHGLRCENDGKNYYCLISPYFDTLLGYSVYYDAFQEDNLIYVQEYFLNINLEDKDKCLSYFNEEYCSNYSKMEKPVLDEDLIKEKGVLFEHVFVEADDNYYLERSYAVSER